MYDKSCVLPEYLTNLEENFQKNDASTTHNLPIGDLSGVVYTDLCNIFKYENFGNYINIKDHSSCE